MDDDDDLISPSPSPSQSPSPSPPRGISIPSPSTDPVTIAAPPQQNITLALPIQTPRPNNGREDCWSEGATSALIDAWGERYLELSRGILKQKQWQEVADAVSSRDDYTKPHKTDVQCKNRVDTLKKKYKLETSKISSGAAASSSWSFFHRLDLIIGSSNKFINNPPPPPSSTRNSAKAAPARAPLPQRDRKRPSPMPRPTYSSSSAESSDGFPPETVNGGNQGRGFMGAEEPVGRSRGMRELTQAIIGFAKVYERVESSKLQQAMEMEEQRMGFAREIEEQRMQFFMKTHMELTNPKRHRYHQDGSSSKRKRDNSS